MTEITDSRIKIKDKLGAVAVRLGFFRGSYSISPGLYNLNNPDSNSPVFVSANYKLSFDILRKSLKGISCWLLVLDTKGINVWCAAGKGTFGTDELVERIDKVQLSRQVNHKNIIVPQLGAPGIKAREIRLKTGFRVIYGPVEARDIPEFISNGLRKSEQMRRKTFRIRERLVLVPVELIHAWKLLLPIIAASILFSFFTAGPEKFDLLSAVLPGILGVVSGGLLMPTLLPWLPFRAFSLKGVFSGVIVALLWLITTGPELAAALFGGGLLITSSSFVAMNFTGSSTFTSLSGVRKEMRIAVPAQIVSVFIFTVSAIFLAVFGG